MLKNHILLRGSIRCIMFLPRSQATPTGIARFIDIYLRFFIIANVFGDRSPPLLHQCSLMDRGRSKAVNGLNCVSRNASGVSGNCRYARMNRCPLNQWKRTHEDVSTGAGNTLPPVQCDYFQQFFVSRSDGRRSPTSKYSLYCDG